MTADFLKFSPVLKLCFICLVLLMASCVTNKKFQMLQKNDVNKKTSTPDSVMREYALEKFDYKIQPNDLISIRFQSLTDEDLDIFTIGNNMTQITNPNLGGALLIGELVDDNGQVNYPVVGKVTVGGLTVMQAQEQLQKIAEQYLKSPVVRVRLVNYRFTLLGEVNREGTVTFPNNRVNYLEAIALAGGMTDLADRANVKLIRQINGKTEIAYLNLLSEDFINSPYYYVYQNDVLVVPPLKQRPFRKYFGPNLALIVSSVSILLLTLNLINQ